MRRISLQGRQTFGEGRAEANPFEFMYVLPFSSSALSGFLWYESADSLSVCSALEALLAQTTRTLFKGSDSLQERYTDLMDTLRTSEQIPTSALQKMLEIKGGLPEHRYRYTWL